MDTNKIAEIVAKIRHIYRYDTFSGIKKIVSEPAKVVLFERVDNGQIELSRIEFDFYDKIVATSTSITFYPEIGMPHQILQYKDFDGLLAL